MRRGRRRGRIALSVVGAAVVVGVLGWGSMQLVDVFTGSGKASATDARRDCVTTAGKSGTRPGGTASPGASAAGASAAAKPGVTLPQPKQIKVNVLNATTRSGLAKDTADALKKRGFTIGQVGNATPQYDKKVKGAGVLLGPPSSLDGALTVLGTQVVGAEKHADGRKGQTVDLIIGNGFKGLSSEAAAAKALDTLLHPAPAPSPSKGSC